MIALPPLIRVFLYRLPTDMRKSFHGLVALTESAMQQDPLSGSLFVFLNRRRDRLKILYWGQTGFCIWYQQLQKGTYQLPEEPREGQEALEVTSLPFASAGDFSRCENCPVARKRHAVDAPAIVPSDVRHACGLEMFPGRIFLKTDLRDSILFA